MVTRILLLSLVFWGSILSTNAQTGWKKFTHPKYKYSISYPPDWTPHDMTAFMGFVIPKEGDDGQLPENVNVVVEDHKEDPVTLDKLAEQNREQIKELMGEGGKLKESKTTLVGLPAFKFDEQFETQGSKLHIVQYFVIKSNIAYVFTFTAKVATFAKYEPTATKVINSFKFPK